MPEGERHSFVETHVEAPESDESRREIFRKIRERQKNFYEGEAESTEKIDMIASWPDTGYDFGHRVTIAPAEWWQTKSVVGERVLNYPEKYAMAPKDVSEGEKETRRTILRGGLWHELGHHVGMVRTLEKFMYEADTQEPILINLGLGQAAHQALEKRFRRSMAGAEEKADLEQLANEVRLGPYLVNQI